MLSKNNYVFIIVSLFLIVTSISCAFATDVNTNSTDIGITTSQQVTDDSPSVYVDDISETNVVDDIIISGYITDKEKDDFSDSEVNIIAEGTSYGFNEYELCLNTTVKTSDNGSFVYNYKPVTGGTLNVTVNYQTGSSVHSQSVSTFIMPKKTLVTYNISETIDIGDSFDINGRLTDNEGNALRYTAIGVLFSGRAYGEDEHKNYSKEYTRTDNNGFFTYKLVPEVAGFYDIIAYFPGYGSYRYSHSDNAVTVMAKDTIITVDPIAKEEVDDGEEITLTGKLTDSDRNPLRFTGVGVLRSNGEKTYTRTDENGVYNYTIITDTLDNEVIVYYPGYHNYRFSQDTVKVKTENEQNIHLDPIRSIHLGSSVIINGSIMTTDNKPITNRSVYIFLEDADGYALDGYDEPIDIYTDVNGIFTYNFTPEKTGTITVRANSPEHDYDKYCFYEDGITDDLTYFNVYKEEDDIVITSIERAGYLNSTWIRGYVSFSEESLKYFNNGTYPIHAFVTPTEKKFEEQCNSYTDYCYLKNNGFVFQIEDKYEYYIPNTGKYVTIVYELSNEKNITSEEIFLDTQIINNVTELVGYNINGSYIYCFIENREYIYDDNPYQIIGTVVSPYDSSSHTVNIKLYDNDNPKNTIITRLCKICEDDSFSYEFSKTELLEIGKLYNTSIVNLGINVTYDLVSTRNVPEGDVLTLTNVMSMYYTIDDDKLTFEGANYDSYGNEE